MCEESPKVVSWLLVTALLHAWLVVPLQTATAFACVGFSSAMVESAATGQSGVVQTPLKCHKESGNRHCGNNHDCPQGGCGLGHCGGTSLPLLLHIAASPLAKDRLPAFVAFGKDWTSSPEPKPPR